MLCRLMKKTLHKTYLRLKIWSRNILLRKIRYNFNKRKIIYTEGVDFTKIFRHKKLPAHINFAVQFHQQLKLQILSLNWCTFCQTLSAVCPIWAPKKAPHPVIAKKAARVCWWNRRRVFTHEFACVCVYVCQCLWVCERACVSVSVCVCKREKLWNLGALWIICLMQYRHF